MINASNQNQLAKNTEWDKLQFAFRRKQIDYVDVAGIEPFPYRKGETALVVFVDTIKGYIPFSETGLADRNSLFSMIGSKVPVVIDDLNRNSGLLLFSVSKAKIRLATETMKSLKAGDVVSGIVQRLTRSKITVDIGGVDAELPKKELAWAHVDEAKNFVKIGQSVQVKVLEIKESGKVVVSKRAIEPDPWFEVTAQLRPGQAYMAEVTGQIERAIFVQLPGGVPALAPARFQVKKGKRTVVLVTAIESEKKRVHCKIIRVLD